jgi:hypothetical protein
VLLAALVLSSAKCGAQAPPQFKGLLTTTTDYTCAGVVPCPTWPMPAMPAAGGSYFDPTWGTTTYRLAIPSANPAQAITTYSRVQAWNSNNTLMFLSETGAPYMDLYDATQTPPAPINRITISDGTLLFAGSGDAYWANTNPTRIYYIPFGGSGGTGLQLRYVDVSACTTSKCTLTPKTVHTFSCASDKYFPGMDIASWSITTTGSTSVVTFYTGPYNENTLTAGQTVQIYGLTAGSFMNGQTLTVSATGLVPGINGKFEATLTGTFSAGGNTADNGIAGLAGVAGNAIESGSGGQGGFFDATDTYFSFTCDNTGGNGRAEIDWIRYRKDADTVTTQKKWYTVCPGGVPAGCPVWGGAGADAPSKEGINMIRMNQHPNQAYIQVLWQCGTAPPWTRGCGTEYYSPTYTLLGPVNAYNGHNDHGYDVNGKPVYVGVNGTSGKNADSYSVTISDLTALSPSAVVSKNIYLPCSYAYGGANPCTFSAPTLYGRVNGTHVSMTGTWGSTPGYALYSTMVLAGTDGGPPELPAPTTLGTAVSSPGVATVTPGSMRTIGVGTEQLIDWGSANAESVTVTAVTVSTFTATFTKTHPSSASVHNLSAGDTHFGSLENFFIKIDTNAPNGSAAQIWRVGRTMSIRDGDYNAEPHTAVNRDSTAITWGSNWNRDGGKVYSFWTRLPAAAPNASPAVASPGAKSN